MPPIIEVDRLSKRYGSGTVALDEVSLAIEPGEILALLGPNGAGKTTLISIICGLVVPTGGTVRVGGHDIRTDWRAARRLIGLVPQEIALEPFETVIDSVRFTRGLYGEGPDEAYLEQLLRSLALWEKRGAKTRELSGGMKRRVLIAKALSHRPRVLFLDEPTAGVDVHLRREMWQVVRDLRAQGVTIILTTHYLEEAEALCQRIAMLKRGQVIALERTSTLLANAAASVLHFKTDSALPPALAAQARVTGRTVELPAYAADDVERHLSALREAGVRVEDLEIRKADLEDVFLKMMGATPEAPPPAGRADLAEAEA